MYWVKIYTSIDKKHNIDIGLHLPILASFKLFLTTFEYKIQANFSKNIKTAIQFTWFYQLYTQTHSSIPIEDEGRNFCKKR